MTRKILMAFTVCSVFLGAGFLSAFELEGFAGMLTQTEELVDDRSPVYGLRFGGGARRMFTGETTIAYSPSENLKTFLLLGNFNINIPINEIIPYITVGTGTFIYVPEEGAAFLDPDDPTQQAIGIALTTKASFSVNYGGGVRYMISDVLAVRGDFRDHIIFNLGFDTSAQTAEETIEIGTSHSIEMSLGLSLVFF